MSTDKRITRRAALARLGLGVTAGYVVPTLVGISAAHASSPTPPSPPSPASPPSPPSPASPPSAPSGASAPSGPSGAGGGNGAPSQPGQAGQQGGGDRVDCRVPQNSGNMRIAERDYERAQAAIRNGQARPLNEIVQIVRARFPGQPIRVGFSGSGSSATYQIQVVTVAGSLVSVTLNAGSGAIIGVSEC